MIIKDIEYSDKTVRRWKQLKANLQFAITKDWIPILSELEIEAELIEAGHPNFEGKEVECVECPACGKQLQFRVIYHIARHKDMGCEGVEE